MGWWIAAVALARVTLTGPLWSRAAWVVATVGGVLGIAWRSGAVTLAPVAYIVVAFVVLAIAILAKKGRQFPLAPSLPRVHLPLHQPGKTCLAVPSFLALWRWHLVCVGGASTSP